MCYEVNMNIFVLEELSALLIIVAQWMAIDDDYHGIIQFGIPLEISNGTGYI